MCPSAVDMKSVSSLATTVGAALVFLTLLLTACQSKIELPEELAGTYVTSDALYAERYFSLTKSQITMGIGDGRRERHAIQAVYREIEGGRMLYRVVYRTVEGRDQLRFYHDGAGSNGRIILRNRPGIVWTRGESK